MPLLRTLEHAIKCQIAVPRSRQANRHADAMVVASVVGGDLWDKARKAYMTAHPRPFMRLLHSVLSGDWQGEHRRARRGGGGAFLGGQGGG